MSGFNRLKLSTDTVIQIAVLVYSSIPKH